jgi:hypothetical protein
MTRFPHKFVALNVQVDASAIRLQGRASVISGKPHKRHQCRYAGLSFVADYVHTDIEP